MMIYPGSGTARRLHAAELPAPTGARSWPRRWHRGRALAAVVAGVASALAGLGTAAPSLAATTTSAAFVAPAGSASARLPDGRWLVAGGCAAGHCPSVLTAAEIFDPATGQAVATGSTITPHGYATLTVLSSGKALLAGGCSRRLCGSANPTAELWDPATGAWTGTGTMLSDPTSGISPEHASAVLLNSGAVLVAGGVNYSAVAQTWNPTTGVWQATSPMRSPRESFTLTTLPSGLVLAAGGCAYYYCQTILGSAELYHPISRTWTRTGSMIHARYNHAATLLPTGQVQVVGGTDGSTTFPPTELYTPTTGTWAAKK